MRANGPGTQKLTTRIKMDKVKRRPLVKRKVADTKQKLSEAIRAAEKEPLQRPSLGEAFSELRRLCSEEGYTLEIPSRSDVQRPI